MTDDDAVSLGEAARITGLSTDALRLRWRRGTLPGYKSGRRLFLYRHGLPGGDRSERPSAEQFATERDRSEIDLLREQLAVKDRQISELHVLLGQAQQQLLAPPATEPTERPTGWWRRWFGRSG